MEKKYGPIVGRKINSPIKSIDEILSGDKQGIFVAQGEVFGFNSRKINDNYVNSGIIEDSKGGVIRFQHNWTEKPLKIEDGDYITVQGKIIVDKYANNDWSVECTSIERVLIPLNEKTDTAEIKRTELALHSEFSRMSGVASAEKIVKKIKNFGHEVFAITDNENVQIYPSIYSEAKKEGIKVIFGVKLNLVDSSKKFVYNSTNQSIDNSTLIAFDVETTGLSVNYRSLTELGATLRYPDGTFERFQCFVKPDEEIPTFITELTGITNEMVREEGLPLEEAVKQFHEFINKKGAILIAHNAPFDRDWMKVAYEKLGLEFPKLPIIDTLPLSRFLREGAKSHRLNNVASSYGKQRSETLDLKKKELNQLKKQEEPTEEELETISFLEWEQNKNERIAILENEIQELNIIIKNLHLKNHHRANEDAEVTIHVFTEMLKEESLKDCETLNDLNALIPKDAYKHEFSKEIPLLVQNEVGLKNLYKLITLSHINRLYRSKPLITKEDLEEHREGILIGSGSYLGPLFEATDKKPIEQAIEEASFYDYIEIEPSLIAEHQIVEGNLANIKEVDETWHKIYKIAKKLNKPVVATGHVHYLEENDFVYHNILLYHFTPSNQTPYERRMGRKGFERKHKHLRTTKEMLDCFPYLSKEERYEIVVTNSRMIADRCKMVQPVPDGLFAPEIEGANEELEELAIRTAKEIYGENLPEIVKARLDKELKSIIGNGFAVIYLISQKLVKNSMDNGYLVGSRGSVGSSFVATMTGITEVNPLKPHYVSKHSNWNVFFDHEDIASGFDLPTYLGDLLNEERYSKSCIEHVVEKMSKSFNKTNEETVELMKNHIRNSCPITGKEGLVRDGQDIPFETFLGFKGDKVPDIDLNFSGEYQTTSHKYVEELFGEKFVFRAGTIGTVADKMAYGYIKSYAEENDKDWSNAKIEIMKPKVQGTKRTSGQHPGGIIVVPTNKDVEDFTPLQHPANKPEEGIRTSHFDFHSIHDNLLKLDILGHDDPTILRRLFETTGIDPKTVAPNDEKALMLFTNPSKALGIDMNDITAKTGTLGVPEFGTKFVQEMILDTKPTTFDELMRISGLSHGTDVWLGNAKDLITNGICTLKSVIDTRDNIMVFLMQKGMEPSLAFKIMESVRKGKGLTEEWIEEMKKYNVPDYYIQSCLKIKYMFPKAHAAAYVLSAMRIANFKVYYPTEFYTAILSVRSHKEISKEIIQKPEQLRQHIASLSSEIDRLKGLGEKNKAGRIEDTKNAAELVLEAIVRGVKFGSIDLDKSHATRYIIDENNVIIPPFSSIAGIGDEKAKKAQEERDVKTFSSVEDLKSRGGFTNTNISALRELGCLKGIEDIQCTFF